MKDWLQRGTILALLTVLAVSCSAAPATSRDVQHDENGVTILKVEGSYSERLREFHGINSKGELVTCYIIQMNDNPALDCDVSE